MKELFKYIKIDKIMRLSLQIATVLLFGQIVILAFFYFSLPPLIPLFNQLPWGEDRLGHRLEIFLPSGIALLFLMSNLFLANHLYERLPLVARILSIATLLLSILSGIFTMQTLLIIL